MRTSRPKITWSYYELPGFVKARWPATGYVPMNTYEEDEDEEYQTNA